jgi:DNA-binding transcriptional LysR family regulator
VLSRTRQALEAFDNQHDFERLAADVLNGLGYQNVEPMAPGGGPDAGRDIKFTEAGARGIALVTLDKRIVEKSRKYPEVQLELHVSDRMIDLVEERFDVAVRLGKLNDSRLVARRLATGTLTTCAAPAYIKQHGVPRHSKDLANHNCIQFIVPSTGRAQPWQFKQDGRHLSVPVQGNLRVDHAEALVEAALAGTAIIQISSYVTKPAMSRGQLHSILAPYQIDSPPIWVLHPQSANPTPRLRAFVDFLVQWGADYARA